MTWIVSADFSSCRIYQYQKHPKQLTLIKEIFHPSSKLKDTDLVTDAPGRYQASGSAQGAFTPRTDPKEVEIDNFAREIARELDRGRNANAYKSLIIIMAPHMHGLLSKHLDKHVHEMIEKNIQKDYQHLDAKDLLVYLNSHL